MTALPGSAGAWITVLPIDAIAIIRRCPDAPRRGHLAPMAKLYFLPRSLSRDSSWILRAGWRIEAAFVGGFFRLLQLLPLKRAARLSAWLFELVGPHTDIQTNLLRNLAVMHPDEPIEVLEARARRSFRWMGRAVAEITHIPEIARRPDVDPPVALAAYQELASRGLKTDSLQMG